MNDVSHTSLSCQRVKIYGRESEKRSFMMKFAKMAGRERSVLTRRALHFAQWKFTSIMKDACTKRDGKKHAMLVFELRDALLIMPAKCLCLKGTERSERVQQVQNIQPSFLYGTCKFDHTVPFSR